MLKPPFAQHPRGTSAAVYGNLAPRTASAQRANYWIVQGETAIVETESIIGPREL